MKQSESKWFRIFWYASRTLVVQFWLWVQCHICIQICFVQKPLSSGNMFLSYWIYHFRPGWKTGFRINFEKFEFPLSFWTDHMHRCVLFLNQAVSTTHSAVRTGRPENLYSKKSGRHVHRLSTSIECCLFHVELEFQCIRLACKHCLFVFFPLLFSSQQGWPFRYIAAYAPAWIWWWWKKSYASV